MLDSNERRTSLIIWGALVTGVTIFLVVTVALPLGDGITPDPALARVLVPVAALLSVSTVSVSWLWAVRFRPATAVAGAAPLTDGSLARARLIVAGALCEGSALFGLVVFFVTRDPWALGPFTLSYVALLAHFPGQRHWARLLGSAPAGSRPNRMIRG